MTKMTRIFTEMKEKKWVDRKKPINTVKFWIWICVVDCLDPYGIFFFFAFLNMETKTFKETNPNQTKIFVLFHKIEDSKIS